MNNRKNYNSIVFLTTLSVYLGLVLAGGGGAHVLAQAALTRDFDIKNEIVFEDDLDKKPDDDLFAESIVDLVQELDKLSREKSFDWNAKNDFRIEGLGFCESDNSRSLLGSGSINSQVDEILENAAAETARKLFTRKASLGFGDIYSHASDYDFILDSGSLEINVKIFADHKIAGDDEKDILPFVNKLNDYLARISSNKKAAKEKIVAEKTKVTTENNQVFIVTRLPRASIDALLAEKTAR